IGISPVLSIFTLHDALPISVLRVYAPASIGNVSVGFDALGLALAPIDGTLLGDIVELRPASTASAELDDWQLTSVGPFAHKLPRSEEHTSELQSREKLICRL